MVRLNPLRHAALSQTPVLPLLERADDWEKLRQGIHDFFGVQGLAWPEFLADKLAGLYWRYLRAQRFEAESITRQLYDVPRDWRVIRAKAGLPIPAEVTPEAVAEMDAMLMARLLPDDEIMDKALRYETRVHRFLLQTEHQLLVLMGIPDKGTPNRSADGGGEPRVTVKGYQRSRPHVRPS